MVGFWRQKRMLLLIISPYRALWRRRMSSSSSYSFLYNNSRNKAEVKQHTEATDKASWSHRLPSLMLPPNFVRAHYPEEKDNDYLYCYYSLGEKKIVGFKEDSERPLLLPWEKGLLLPNDARCLGSSHGWLAYVVPRRNCPLYLFKHPLFSSPDFFSPSSMIRLPPLETLQSVTGIRVRKSTTNQASPVTRDYYMSEGGDDDKNNDEFVCSPEDDACGILIKKLILSSAPALAPAPTSSSNCIAMAIVDCHQGLAFCGLGDDSWTCLDPFTSFPGYDDVIYSNADGLFYALSYSPTVEGTYGFLDCWDLNDHPNSPPKRTALIKALVCLPQLSRSEYLQREFDCYVTANLVESEGELLMVRRIIAYNVREDGSFFPHPLNPWGKPRYLIKAGFTELTPVRTVRFDVFKLDSVREKWEPLDCLGDHRALFVGLNHSFSIPAPPSSQVIQGNSIYFTDQTTSKNHTHSCDGQDMGIFLLEDNTVEQLYPCNPRIIHPPPVWVVASE